MRRSGTEYRTSVEIGNDLELLLLIKDHNNEAVALDDAELRALVKENPEDLDDDAVSEFSDITLTEGTTGAVAIRMTAADTAALTFGQTYYWDLKVTLPDDHPAYPGRQYTPVYGQLTADQIITRSSEAAPS